VQATRRVCEIPEARVGVAARRTATARDEHVLPHTV
jgi:hypothetical protein